MTDKQTDAPQKQVHWARDYGDFVSDWFDDPKDVRGPQWRDDDPECIAVIRREWVEGEKMTLCCLLCCLPNGDFAWKGECNEVATD